MNFEEFEKASGKELRAQAKECFDKANENPSWGGAPTLLLQSQFYMQEMDRRHDGRIATRDLILEIVVILLIGGEIWLGWHQGIEQGKVMDKQIGALQTLNDNATATGKTLQSLQSTTEAMNGAVQRQLGIVSEVSVAISFDETEKRLDIVNGSERSVELWGSKAGDQLITLWETPIVVVRGGHHYLPAQAFYSGMVGETAGGHHALRTPFELYVKGYDGTQYVVSCEIIAESSGKSSTHIYTRWPVVIKKRWAISTSLKTH